jgi:hypothetical protein
MPVVKSPIFQVSKPVVKSLKKVKAVEKPPITLEDVCKAAKAAKAAA